MNLLRFITLCSLAVAVPLGAPQAALARDVAARLPAPPTDYSYERLLPLEGAQNFRDLGGYPTQDGRHVRWGLLFRSGSMHGLTPADFAYLQRLHLRTVFDFRATQEREAEPSRWPAGQAPRIVTKDYDAAVLKAMVGTTSQDPHVIAAAIVKSYPRILSEFNGQYRQVFEQLLDGASPLVIHCSAGRDRTGVGAALILTALGVPRETVIQDYLLTNRYFDLQKTGAAAQTWGRMNPDLIASMKSSARPSIESIFAVIDAHPGGAMGYLRDELGVDAQKIARLRAMYTE